MSFAFRRVCVLGLLALLVAVVPLARPAQAATFTVNSLADTTAAGTLRWAIGQANATAGQDTINFSVAGTITLASSLPILADQTGTIIDGRNAGGSPTIEIRGGGTVSGDGLLIQSSNNIVRGLIINGFSGAGIDIDGSVASANNNRIEQNYIGTNIAGNATGITINSNNRSAGVRIQFGASSNIINNNVISGNRGFGVYVHTLYAASTSVQQSNTISNNKIGVTADGATALGNGLDGVYIGDNSNNNVIGPGNVIGANGVSAAASYGVTISGNLLNANTATAGNRVIGNKIGTNAAGTAAVANRAGGIFLGKSNNTAIGGPNGNAGTAGGDGNLISGNTGSGVEIQDDSPTADFTGVVLQNNWIGVNASGNAALPNTDTGVFIWKQAQAITVGPNNVISGNQFYGVQLYGVPNQADPTKQTRNNVVTGNIIGAGVDGTTAVPNGITGIDFFGGTTGNTINGNNRILSNSTSGIYFEADQSATPLVPTNNTISGNTISSNNTTGIALLVGTGNTIGPGNTISGHTSAGVQIEASQNTVSGNTISSNQIGINITNGAQNNTIGGANLSDGNNLINNSVNGVLVSGSGVTGNKISHTTTNNNGGKGIALSNGGNAPISGASLSVTPPASGFTLTGTASGCTGGCTIEVFTDDNPLDNEGPTFLPTTPALTGINGAFSTDITGCRHYLIFTLTDAAGNTSEFLSPTASIPQCVPAAPIVSLSDATPAASQSGLPGAVKTFQHIVKNEGSAAGALTITKSSSNAWTTALDTSACPATLAAGASCTITLAVTIPAGAAPGERNDTTITATLAGAAASASKTDSTTALLNASLTFTPDTQAKTTGAGQPVSYQHTLMNTGSGTDTFSTSVTLAANMSGWSYSVQPRGLISLPANGSTQVTVIYTPTAGIASPPVYTATVRAFSTSAPSSAFKDVTDVTSISSAAVPQLSSVVTPANVDAGKTVTITYTLTNAGNIDGQFNFSFTNQGNWTATPATPPPVTVAKGASTSFTVTLQVPPSALAGPYQATLTATANSAPNASATKSDTITVNKQAALVLDPDINDPTTRAPSSIITYTTQILQNNGNFTDTIQLAAKATRAGWSARPISTSVTLNPGASTQIKVELTIPPGELAGVKNTTHVTATSSIPAVFDSALITTTIASVPGVLLTPKTSQQTVLAGHPATYTLTLQNSGSIAQSYTITRTGVPNGWGSTLTPTTTQTLQPGQTRLITFTLTAPANTPDGTPASVDITATCNENPCAASTATAKLLVGPPFNVGVSGQCSGSALPGALVTCVHTITNTGFVSDTYVLTARSQLGWRTAVAPPSVLLAPGASRTFTITLAVPTSADAGLVHSLLVTARSTAAANVAAPVTDTTTVLQVAGVSLSPNRSAPAVGGREIQFQHDVLNTGNGLDTFVLTATQDLNWSITFVPTQTTALPRGTYQTILLKIQVPADVPPNAINRLTVKATSQFAPGISDQVIDTIGVAGAPNRFTYMPLVSR